MIMTATPSGLHLNELLCYVSLTNNTLHGTLNAEDGVQDSANQVNPSMTKPSYSHNQVVRLCAKSREDVSSPCEHLTLHYQVNHETLSFLKEDLILSHHIKSLVPELYSKIKPE
jgi:hypothetical protein